MIFVTILDAQGVEKVRNEVTDSIPQDILEAAAKITCEVWNRDHTDDKWNMKIVNTEES